MKWSQSYFPKVLGGLFLTSLVANASEYSEYKEALDAARKAALIELGVTKRINKLKKQAAEEVKDTLKEYDMLEEAATVGGVLQIIKEKGVKMRYEGVDYFITPTQVKVIIHL